MVALALVEAVYDNLPAVAEALQYPYSFLVDVVSVVILGQSCEVLVAQFGRPFFFENVVNIDVVKERLRSFL